MEDNTSTSSTYEKPAESSGNYGKRPMWQWVLLYLVIGAIIYYAVYYFAFAKKEGGYTNSNPSSATQGY